MSDTIGQRLDAAGMTVELDDDEYVVEAVVLLRLAKLDAPAGQTRLAIGASETCDAIVQSGLLHQATAISDAALWDES